MLAHESRQLPSWLIFDVGQSMHVDDILGPPVAFGEYLRNPALLPQWAWLYSQERDVTITIACRATLADSRELSDEEYESRDASLEKEGFACLVSREQLESVIANLRHRYPNPTGDQLEEAVRFYLKHDAFIVA